MEGNCDKAPQKCLSTCDFLTSLKLCTSEMEPLAQLTMQFIIPDFVFIFLLLHGSDSTSRFFEGEKYIHIIYNIY